MNHMTKVRALLEAKRMDAAYLTSPENVRYATGCAVPGARALVLPHAAYLFCEDTGELHCEPPMIQCRENACTDREIRRILRESGGTVVGVEDRRTPYFCYRLEQESLLRGMKCAPLSEALEGLRARKEPWELDLLERAQAMNRAVFPRLLQTITVGQSEWEIACEIDCLLRKAGADGTAFPTTALIGENTLYPHRSASKTRLLRDGDVVMVDYGCKLEGYCSDFARTFMAGSPTQAFTAGYRQVTEAFRSAVESMRPGAAANRIGADGSPGNRAPYSLGHGVGLEVHEAPFLNSRSEAVLLAGNALSLEPDYVCRDEWRMRIEDMVFITETGARTLWNPSSDAPDFVTG